jgi:hypothetical protein|tara:strand:- start:7508 stop:8155 length:648 start_codon:yes stop_codon:yes gene_type:complete
MKYIITILFFIPIILIGQETYQIAILKYNGGGDWYANPTSLSNLIRYSNKNIGTNIQKDPAIVEVGSIDIFNYPFLYMTGHGNVVFSNNEAENLKKYLQAGGFLHIDDNYGMDPYIRTEIKKVFPNIELSELTNNHPIFSVKYKFKNGIPKVHEHDAQRSQAFGIIYNGRLVCLYTYESDLGDGWEDKEVHNNSDEIRLKALKMGANILKYVFTY